MLDVARRYLPTFKNTAIALGSAYAVQRYIRDRLEETRDALERDRRARDSLKRRFRQTHEDISYAVLALIPTLSEQILEGMDVEALIQELQNFGKAKSASLSLNVEDENGSSRSMSSSMSVVSEAASVVSLGSSSEMSFQPESDMSMSASVSSISPSEVSLPDSTASSTSFSSSKTKASLWNAVKILSLTRTLTLIYTTTLLSLLTSQQLALLGRARYLSSVLAAAREERLAESIEEQLSITGLLFGNAGEQMEELMSGNLSVLFSDLPEGPTEDTEARFLTMSWWLLHVGWKDVGERVRSSVEDVFEGVSLKTRLTLTDLHRLILDVRRRIDLSADFLHALLPSTPELTAHVLAQGGFGPSTPPSPSISDISSHAWTTSASAAPNLSQLSLLPPEDESLAPLLEELHGIVQSVDFGLVLDRALDTAVAILFADMERSVFPSSNVEEMADEPRMRLAGLLPALQHWSQDALKGLPCVLVDNILSTREVGALEAIVFARFEDDVKWR
ncbi:Peroxin-3 [Desarmillaria tabescens]|uniref:Peroxin-3 n=1 Tax=Armillaria tabescens TaxID=1929756 RepID=A0AA39JXH6_ARMTA|nr:Peroxin-3 [Desarmillaria tabescens]KAK0450417.1 Peroxin-3 [Desarmillaria tabescens]